MVWMQAFSPSLTLRKSSTSCAVAGAASGEVKCFERRAVNHKRDRHVLRPAHAVKMIADIAKDESDFVEIGQMIERPWPRPASPRRPAATKAAIGMMAQAN